MIVHVHIPKTGGHTLNQIAKNTLGTRALVVNSESELDSRMPDEQPGQALTLDYLGGHFRLGHVQSLLADRGTATEPRFVTLVRDPVERAFSPYLFLLRVKTAIPHVTNAVQERDFAYFIDYAYDNAAWHLQDAQAWLLCGERSARRAQEVISRDLSVVGTTEAWDRFYHAVRVLDGLPFPEDVSGCSAHIAPQAERSCDILQGSKPANWREVIGDASIRKLEHINQADFELYDYVARQHGGLMINAA